MAVDALGECFIVVRALHRAPVLVALALVEVELRLASLADVVHAFLAVRTLLVAFSREKVVVVLTLGACLKKILN